VMAQMQIKDKVASRGIRQYEELAKESGLPVVRLECTPIEYVELLTTQLASAKDWYSASSYDKIPKTNTGKLDVRHVCLCIESILEYLTRRDVKSNIKNSIPRCIAAATVYFHFVATGCEIRKEYYAGLCGCSIASIEKLHDDIVCALKGLVVV